VEVVGALVTAFLIALLVTLAWGTLAFGAVYPWAYWPLAAACAGLGCWGLARGRRWPEGRLGTLSWALAGVAAAIGVQLIPVPLRVFRAISPNGDRFLAQYDLGYAFQAPPWHALSVAPDETFVTLLLFLAFALFLMGLAAMIGELPLERLVMGLALFGVAIGVLGVVERVLTNTDETRSVIYGFWHTEQGGRPFAPFVNPNHFAGWMLLVIALALGYVCGLIQASWRERGRELRSWLVWLTRPDAGRLALLGLCTLAMATALILTRSRSGAAALSIVLLVFAYRASARLAGVLPKLVAVVAVSAVFVGALLWAGAGPIVSKFSASATDAPGRIGAWRDAVHIFRDFPIFGAGMGSFSRLMLFYQSTGRESYFTQAHNDYLQILAEGGLLVSAAGLGLIATIAMTAAHRFRQDVDPVINWIRFGAVAGLIGVAAQSTVEFSLQMPGVAALFVVLIAIAVHRRSNRTLHAHRL
jgi:O-antigen ligase